MKTILITEIFFKTNSGHIFQTGISFKNVEDAKHFIKIKNTKNELGEYFYKSFSKVCYESLEEYNNTINKLEIEK